MRQHDGMKRRELLIAAWPAIGWAPCGRAGSVSASLPASASEADADGPIVARLREGRVAVLLRHAITDAGIGDPTGFRLGACSTQRNLSAEGRAQARRIGAWFEARALAPARVRSSAWCRCIDTGMLAFGRATAWEALNSIFEDSTTGARRSTTARQALPRIGAGAFEVWVTHQVNITALTGGFASMGEAYLAEVSDVGKGAEAEAPLSIVARFRPGD